MNEHRSLAVALAQQSWAFMDSPLAGLYDCREYKRLPVALEPTEGAPCLVHLQWHQTEGRETILNLADDRFPEMVVADRVVEAIEALCPRWVSLHLGFSTTRVVALGQGKPAVGDGLVLSRAEVLSRLVENVAWLRARLPDVPLLLENLDYMPREISGAYEYVCEPEFVGEALAATGCALLLDLAHAQVSAGNLGRPWPEYVERLPLDAVRQVHLSRPVQQGALWVDAHLPIGAEEADRLAALLPQLPRCEVVTLETFGPPEALEPQLRLLQRFRSERMVRAEGK